MMNEKPILFNAEMVRAILNGRKTQTRRVVKPQPLAIGDQFGYSQGARDDLCPYGQVGDLLWVRETWCTVDYSEHELCVDYLASNKTLWINPGRVQFEKYTYENFDSKTRPSIFMPRWASRITLRVTDVRIERVQDIAEDDAREEGVTPPKTSPGLDFMKHELGFRSLWDSINAKRGYGWNVNPWVWVVEFELESVAGE